MIPYSGLAVCTVDLLMQGSVHLSDVEDTSVASQTESEGKLLLAEGAVELVDVLKEIRVPARSQSKNPVCSLGEEQICLSCCAPECSPDLLTFTGLKSNNI